MKSIPACITGRPGATELISILAVLLLLFGAKRLPELSRSLGGSINEFKIRVLPGFPGDFPLITDLMVEATLDVHAVRQAKSKPAVGAGKKQLVDAVRMLIARERSLEENEHGSPYS